MVLLMRFIKQELIKIRNRTIWSWYGFSHVAKTEGSLWQWIIANIISGSLTFFLPITYTQQAIILAGGILILAAECLNTAIERVVDDISIEQRPAAKQAKDAGSAAVAITAIATGVVWVVIIYELLLR
tara:strand:+ start:858 stop:1241 length:384 start_codon:yes stop_codon:yes gene_type:complete